VATRHVNPELGKAIRAALPAVSLVMRRTRAVEGGPSDEALLASMAEGDERAGLEFVRRYQGRVFGLAMSMLGDPGHAEDVAQEALLRAWRHAPIYDARRGAVSTWVLTIARNLTIDALRMRRAIPTDPDDLIGLGLVSNEVSPDDAAVNSEGARGVRLALAGLRAEQRRALVLAYFYGMTAAEIGEAESIPLGTAKTRIRAGLTKLRETMTSGGVER
jgi:RNA polymerase sigma factor (sigma-70 family)